MVNRAELFLAQRSDASSYAQTRARGVDGVSAPLSVDVAGLSDLEIEALGAVATAAVHAGGVDCALDYSDVSREDLYVVPRGVVVALSELPDAEDADDLITAVAERWAAAEEFESTLEIALPLVKQIIVLAVEAERSGLDLFLWSE